MASNEPLRVGVVGGAGRMGREVCRAVQDAVDLALVAAVRPRHTGQPVPGTGLAFAATLDALTDAQAAVAVEFTRPPSVAHNVGWCLEHGIHAVVGTTGWTDLDLTRWRQASDRGGANAVVAPNFALGAVLMMCFAALAARHLRHVEIIELHHDRKADAPSGTALRTAELIAAARSQPADALDGGTVAQSRGARRAGVPVHSVRLPGLVAHQEVIFGGDGQTLTIRHDTMDRTAFMPGVLLAVRAVGGLRGVVVGLESLLGLSSRPAGVEGQVS